jgi:signal transduction histidine kinase
VVATPVWVQGEIAAALVGGTREDRRLTTEDVEAFELLASVAGPALENARRFEEERRANERLAELDRLKSDFLSNVSHELRTPLTAIKGMGTTLDQLWDELSDGDRRDLLGRLNSNAASLHHIITTLLDFSQLEAGRLPLEWQDVDAVGLARGLVERLRPMLESHPVEIDAPERLVVRADAVLLDRVLENLVANAVKHTPRGTPVVVAMRARPDRVRIEVTDRGPGIPEAELPHIGERFFRGGDPNTRRTRGTGLGLALVQEILRLHHTSLEVTSTVGEGSRFSFRLMPAIREDPTVREDATLPTT